jgi:hypothetical protein
MRLLWFIKQVDIREKGVPATDAPSSCPGNSARGMFEERSTQPSSKATKTLARERQQPPLLFLVPVSWLLCLSIASILLIQLLLVHLF